MTTPVPGGQAPPVTPPVPTPPPAPPAPPAAPPPAPPAASPATPPAPPAPGAPAPQQERVEDLPEWAQKVIREARGEAAGHRTAKTEAEQKYQGTLDAIAKALGFNEDGSPDPAKLTSELTQAQAAQRQSAVELAVFKAAGPVGANAARLLDSRSFMDGMSKLDPTAADFATKVGEAITAATTADPSLKAQPAGPPVSGAPFTGGGTGGEGQITEEQLKTMTPEQIVEAQEKGLLKNLLGG